MSRVNSIEFFETSKQLVIAENNILPALDGSNLTGIVGTLNDLVGDVTISPGSGFVTISTNDNNSVVIDVDIPHAASLFVILDGKDTVGDTYSISYDKENYIVNINHNLHSRVIGFVYDELDKQAFYGVDYVDDDNVRIQFDEDNFPDIDSVWKVSLGLGGGLPITLSTEIPNNESTHGTVTSSKSVYDFVTNQITVVNQSITDLTEDTDEKFVLVDENFDQVEQRFQTVEQSIENTNNNLNGKIDSEVLRLDGLIEEINEAMKQIGDLLDEINGVEKSSEESSDSSYEEESSSSEEI